MFCRIFILSIISIGLLSCDEIIPELPAENELLDGPTDGLSPSEQRKFLDGDVSFNDEIFSSSKGLGPLFVATSCGSCHAGDGKGHPFTTLVRFGQTLPNQVPDFDLGGPQLQNRAIPGFMPESLPNDVPFMSITPPAVTGLGFLAALTDEQILHNVDSLDENGDGISGIPNYLTPPDYFEIQWFHKPVNGKIIGRFGKKAAAIDLLQQTVNAYNQDMGITSTFEPIDPATQMSVDPEISDQTIRNVVFYLQTLKAPIPRSEENELVIRGKQLMQEIQCTSCHIAEWTTPQSDIEALSNKKFYPYTDLLLHDMGPQLDDGVTEGSAQTYEWRTPPLWGLGLAANSQGGSLFLMHDGRARNIEDAIDLHGGEAENSKNQFTSLSDEDKEAIIDFLNSL